MFIPRHCKVLGTWSSRLNVFLAGNDFGATSPDKLYLDMVGLSPDFFANFGFL